MIDMGIVHLVMEACYISSRDILSHVVMDKLLVIHTTKSVVSWMAC